MWTTGSQLELGLIQPCHCSSRFNPPGEQRAVTSQHFQDWNVWHPRIPADSDLPSGSSAGWEPRAAVPDLSGEERGKPWCSQKGKRRTLCSQNGKGQILMLPEWKEANPGAPRIERGKSWCSQKGKGANPGAARKERGKSWCFQKGKRKTLVLSERKEGFPGAPRSLRPLPGWLCASSLQLLSTAAVTGDVQWMISGTCSASRSRWSCSVQRSCRVFLSCSILKQYFH